MRRFDQLHKKIIQKALSPGGTYTTEMEVSPDAQRFDSYFVPDPAKRGRPRDLLERLGSRPCSFESFHRTPAEDELTECIRKLLNARHELAKPTEGPPSPLPFLWILSAGRPGIGLAGLGAVRMRGWPKGVFRLPSFFNTGIVVLSELPQARWTLLLRLMGARKTLREAAAELKRLSPGTREWRIAAPLLVEYKVEVEADPTRTAEDEEIAMETQDIVQAWERRLKDEGREEGLKKGLKKGRQEGRQKDLLTIYQTRFGAVPANVRAVVESAHGDVALDRLLDLFIRKSAAEVAEALRGR